MKGTIIFILGLVLITISACNGNVDVPNKGVNIPDFNFSETTVFEQKLSAYNIFAGDPVDLIPANDFHVLELSSTLFTDFAHKQRLVKVPEGTQMKRLDDGSIDYPDGTILTKTFFYYNDERDKSLGKRVIETRLLVKESGIWNVATYLWNQAQTDASIEVEGHDTPVSWISLDGSSLSTLYHVPSENECGTCHQSNLSLIPLGTTLRNLNRSVERNGSSLNQINHLQAVGVLNDFPASQLPEIVDYNNLNVSLAERGRAYLAMNCAHCHNPSGWDKATERDFDFSYETPLDQTGISRGKRKISKAVLRGEMPLIGTTMLDQEGVNLIVDYIESL